MMDDVSGDYTAANEPEFDAPPVFAELQERRMHVRAHDLWTGLLRGREFPAPSDFDPDSIGDFGPNSVLLDFADDPENPVLRYIGDRLRGECNLEESDAGLDAIPARSLLSRLTDQYFEIIANRAPVGFEAEFTSRRGNNTLYRGILMPLSSNGSKIDCIYGVINWKEVAESEVEDALALEADFADFSPGEPAPTLADAMFACPAGQDEDGHEAGRHGPAPLAAGASLAERLTHAREAAGRLRGANERSRAALYAALGEAYDFHRSARDTPEDYAELLKDHGVRVQARALMTAVAKLVFGSDCDPARLTEYAAALAHGEREGLAAGAFADFVAGYPGGLKGLVAAERAARRAETKRPAVDRAAAQRARLRAAPPVTSVSMDAAGDEEFVLLVARRDPDGTLALMGAVPRAGKLVDGALRKL